MRADEPERVIAEDGRPITFLAIDRQYFFEVWT
jgi:hypothetical protein